MLAASAGAGRVAQDVCLLDTGTDGMVAMFAARGCWTLIVVDASRPGSEPGAIFEVPGSELELRYEPSLNLHTDFAAQIKSTAFQHNGVIATLPAWKRSFCCAAIEISASCRSGMRLPADIFSSCANKAGDRAVHAPDFFRAYGVDKNIALELSVVWSFERGALVAADAFKM